MILLELATVRRSAVTSLGFVVATHLACGTLGGDGGGGDNLPNRGIVPYEKHPVVIVPSTVGETLHQPSSTVRNGKIDVYFEFAGQIRVATSEDGGRSFGPASDVMTGRAPSVIWVDDVAHIAFETDQGIAHATSSDGRSFGSPDVLLTSGRAPSLVRTDRGFELFVATAAGIARATAGFDLVFGASQVVLTPTEGEWDAQTVTNPEARFATTSTGRSVMRLFYEGRGPEITGIGFAAAFPDAPFSKYRDNPLFDAGEGAPTNVLTDSRYVLFYEDGAGIGTAVNAEGPPSESF